MTVLATLAHTRANIILYSKRTHEHLNWARGGNDETNSNIRHAGSQRESFTMGRRIKQTPQTSEIGATIAIGPSVRYNNSRYVSVSDKWPARGPMHATPKASHPLSGSRCRTAAQQAVALLLLTTFNPFWVKLY